MHCMLSILTEANGISDIIVINGKPSMVKYVMDSVGAVICCFALVGGDKKYEGVDTNSCQIWCKVVCAKLKLWMVFNKVSWAESDKY